jgi:hypothetical protein
LKVIPVYLTIVDFFKKNAAFGSISAGVVFYLLGFSAVAQYPPPAGQPGTTALFVDSSAFIGWAKSCTVIRGYVEISDTTVKYNNSNKATYGDEYYGVGKGNDSVVSLGDGGIATLRFDPAITNGPGFDFAVFENALSDAFLELAFVEVSSDGIKYVRFPSVSLTQTTTQIGTFGSIDATKIYNLAGKYRASYGSPFDLEDLKDSTGIDLNHITGVRIIDVIGSIQQPWATHDSQGHIINDPYPTPFWSCGFDLDAVGVVHSANEGIEDLSGKSLIRVFPNPVGPVLHLSVNYPGSVSMVLSDLTGLTIIRPQKFSGNLTVDVSSVPVGIYFGCFTFPDGSMETLKIIKK